jgi:hypothetical protein
MVHDQKLPRETNQKAKSRQAGVAAKNGEVLSLFRPSASIRSPAT